MEEKLEERNGEEEKRQGQGPSIESIYLSFVLL